MDFGYFGNGASLAADFVNTKSWRTGAERLGEPDAVRAFLAAHGAERRVTKADIAKLHALRERVRSIFTADGDEQARRRIQDLLEDFPSRPQLTADPTRSVAFEPLAGDAVSWIGATCALGLAFSLAEHGKARFGVCGAADCDDAFVDASKNSSKRCCSPACTRLENMRAFRARRRPSTSSG